MNAARAYHRWLRRRLIFLLPAFLAILAVTLRLTFADSATLWIRVSGAVTGTVLAILLVVQIGRSIACSTPRRRTGAGRSQLGPHRTISFASFGLAALLFALPSQFHPRPDPRVMVSLPRHAPPPRLQPVSPPAPVEEVKTAAQRSPAPTENHPPVEIPSYAHLRNDAAEGKPAVDPAPPRERAILPLEPARMELTEREFLLPNDPLTFVQDEPDPRPPSEDPKRAPFLPDSALLRQLNEPGGRGPGEFSRAHPHEAWAGEPPEPEARVDGFLLMGHHDGRTPALSVILDLPLDQNGSLELGWTGAIVPIRGATWLDRGDGPTWNHATLAYVQRLAGYTRHASYDLAASAGVSLDFVEVLEGIDTGDRRGHLAPWASIDAAVWQQGMIGLLVRAGQTFPVAIRGSSVLVTDLSACVRVDFSQQFSLHAGYRFLYIRLREAAPIPAQGTTSLDDSLAGPMIGLDFRF